MKITAVIITKNEAFNITRCLSSLTHIADEVIVVDALSEDETETLCRTFPNVRFVSRVWAGMS